MGDGEGSSQNAAVLLPPHPQAHGGVDARAASGELQRHRSADANGQPSSCHRRHLQGSQCTAPGEADATAAASLLVLTPPAAGASLSQAGHGGRDADWHAAANGDSFAQGEQVQGHVRHAAITLSDAPAATDGTNGKAGSPGLDSAGRGHQGCGAATQDWLYEFFSKWRGAGGKPPGQVEPWQHMAWAWLGAFIAILAMALVQEFASPHIDMPVLVASFGASAVLVFGVPNSPFSQPRSLVGGQLVCALTGVVVRNIFHAAPASVLPVSAAVGMATAQVLMLATRTTHPPGGATALIAAFSPTVGDWAGFKFVVTVAWAAAIMLVVALFVNNLPGSAFGSQRRYPTFWY